MKSLRPEEASLLPPDCRTCDHGHHAITGSTAVETLGYLDTCKFVLECAIKLTPDIDVEARHEACNRRFIRESAKLAIQEQMATIDNRD